SYGVRNVMELQIEEDAAAGINNFAHKRRTCGHKQLTSDFEHADKVPELFDEIQRLVARTHIQCDDNSAIHCFICPTRSRIEDNPFRFKNFCSPFNTCSEALGS